MEWNFTKPLHIYLIIDNMIQIHIEFNAHLKISLVM
jgi:hypothetical protein